MDKAELWGNLTDNQRQYLINRVAPRDQRVDQSWFIAAARALERRGVSPEAGRELATWAIEQGFAQYVDGGWTFTGQRGRRKKGRIDPDRLAELAAAGRWAASIAEQLGVTGEAVRLAAGRQGLTLARKPVKPKPVKPLRVLRPNHFNVAVSDEELATIRQAASLRGVRVSTYLREVLFPG